MLNNLRYTHCNRLLFMIKIVLPGLLCILMLCSCSKSDYSDVIVYSADSPGAQHETLEPSPQVSAMASLQNLPDPSPSAQAVNQPSFNFDVSQPAGIKSGSIQTDLPERTTATIAVHYFSQSNQPNMLTATAQVNQGALAFDFSNDTQIDALDALPIQFAQLIVNITLSQNQPEALIDRYGLGGSNLSGPFAQDESGQKIIAVSWRIGLPDSETAFSKLFENINQAYNYSLTDFSFSTAYQAWVARLAQEYDESKLENLSIDLQLLLLNSGLESAPEDISIIFINTNQQIIAKYLADSQTQQVSADHHLAELPQENIVYVTSNGKKYHQADCSHLRANSIAMALQDALSKGYEPCKICAKKQK